ncbi:MAG: hypothetical protein AMS27_01345 [Bacteroides sp. SM23_62_1]|nr:MAG: hypothetical protein AMS27_01345 [Bacteroides sp. SM23_62_1]
MKYLRVIYNLRVYILILIFKFPAGICQDSPFDPDFYNEAYRIREHVEVLTDRSLYIINEHINFRADLFTEGLSKDRAWSSVLYVELVTTGGTPLARAKFVVSDRMCKGRLTIPPDLLTGNYFLKCYTRWMRNAGPGSFSYTPLKIINPFKPEITVQANEETTVPPVYGQDYDPGFFKCNIEESIFERGEEIVFSLSGLPDIDLQEIHHCITVVPLSAIDTVKGQLTFSQSWVDREEFSVRFLPDLNGTSISGTVVMPGTEENSIQHARIHFSLLGDQSGYFVTKTDVLGKFVVSIPSRTGTQELFVVPEVPDNETVEVRIDQDFDAGTLPVTTIPFTLSAEEHEIATRMALQMQLSEAFAEQAIPEEYMEDTIPVPFYGIYGNSVVLDDYIDLPTLEEVFINLIPSVTFVKRMNKTTLTIHSGNRFIGNYKPLVMVDQIPIFDLDAVISIDPEKVNRIDVTNEVYVKGNVTYGGIVNIITQKGDMGGIELPAGSYFFDFMALQPEKRVKKQIPVPEDRIPDLRNTLLWIPDLVPDEGSTTNITFKAPDCPGEYVILVRGVAGPGEILSATTRFTVE